MGKKKDVVVGEQVEVAAITAVGPKKQKAKKIGKMRTRSKRYVVSRALIDHTKSYPLPKAIELMKKAGVEHFNSSVELHLNVDEIGLKGEVTLPHGTGREVRVAVFDDEIEKKLEKNELDFDFLIARPGDMKQLMRFAKVLGPKGLMPSPKKGTITDDPAKAVKRFKGGSFQYKTEPKFPIMHQVVGRREFTDTQLEENIRTYINAVGTQHIKKAYIASSMSPSIIIDLSNFK